MKRKITLLATLVMSIVLILMTSSAAMAQSRANRVLDSGVIKLGPNQSLRLSVAVGDINDDGVPFIGVQTLKYSQENCQGGICVLRYIEQDNLFRRFSLAANEAVIINTPNETPGIRLRVLTRSNNIKCNLFIINDITGEAYMTVQLENVQITS